MPDISLLPKEYEVKAAPQKASKSLSALSYVFIFLVLTGWGALYFYNKQSEGQIDKIREEIKLVPLEGRESEVRKINESGEKLNNFGDILNGHIYTSNILKEIENSTLKMVYFNKFNLNVQKNILNLSGVADSYTNFSKQFAAFKSRNDVMKNVKIRAINLTRNGVEFSFEIVLVNGVFNIKL